MSDSRTLGDAAVRRGDRARFFEGRLRPPAAIVHAGVRLSLDGSRRVRDPDKGEPLLTWEFAQGRMMWGLFYVFAGGNALGAVLNKAGTAQFLAWPIIPYAAQRPAECHRPLRRRDDGGGADHQQRGDRGDHGADRDQCLSGARRQPDSLCLHHYRGQSLWFHAAVVCGQFGRRGGYGVNLRTMFGLGFGPRSSAWL